MNNNDFITDERILDACKKQSIKECCMRVEDFVKTDLGYIEVIAPVYEELTEDEFNYDSKTFDKKLEERIHNCLDKINKETPDPDYDNPNSDFNKRIDEAFLQIEILQS